MFVPIDLNIHKEIFVKLNVEFITWIADQLRENYQIDTVSEVGKEVSEYVAEHLEDFTCLKPPNGIVYLLEVDGSIIGMGALK